MSRRVLAGLGLAVVFVVVAVLANGSSDDDTDATAEPSPVSTTVEFGDIQDETGSDFYSIGSPATGTIDQLGSELSLPLNVENANGTSIHLTAIVTFSNGLETVCKDDDPRHRVVLNDSTDSADLPCLSALTLGDRDGAVVTVTATD